MQSILLLSLLASLNGFGVCFPIPPTVPETGSTAFNDLVIHEVAANYGKNSYVELFCPECPKTLDDRGIGCKLI